MNHTDRILAHLGDEEAGPYSAPQLAEALGIPKPSARTTCKRLARDGRIVIVGKVASGRKGRPAWLYRLPEHVEVDTPADEAPAVCAAVCGAACGAEVAAAE